MRILTLIFAAGALFAQGLQFEVATIHEAAPLTPEAIRAGKMHIGMAVKGSQVDIGYLSLRDLVAMAYGVKQRQVSGPDWVNEKRYDILALMPEGATEKQVPEMMQALLKERFQLVVKRDSKEEQVYALGVAKGGHKMKDAVPPPEQAPDAAEKPGLTLGNVQGQQVKVNQTPIAGGGMNMNISTGAMNQRMSITPDGKMHMEIDRMTMPELAESLTAFLELPVVDKTDLTGGYQVALDMAMADILKVAQRMGTIPAGTPLPPQMTGAANGLNAADPGGDLMMAVSKLGLRLDKTKLPQDGIVIESAERNPSEN